MKRRTGAPMKGLRFRVPDFKDAPVNATEILRQWEETVKEQLLELAWAVLSALAACPGRGLALILDETPCGDHPKCLKVSMGYRKRAIPLARAGLGVLRAGRPAGAHAQAHLAAARAGRPLPSGRPGRWPARRVRWGGGDAAGGPGARGGG